MNEVKLSNTIQQIATLCCLAIRIASIGATAYVLLLRMGVPVRARHVCVRVRGRALPADPPTHPPTTAQPFVVRWSGEGEGRQQVATGSDTRKQRDLLLLLKENDEIKLRGAKKTAASRGARPAIPPPSVEKLDREGRSAPHCDTKKRSQAHRNVVLRHYTHAQVGSAANFRSTCGAQCRAQHLRTRPW